MDAANQAAAMRSLLDASRPNVVNKGMGGGLLPDAQITALAMPSPKIADSSVNKQGQGGRPGGPINKFATAMQKAIAEACEAMSKINRENMPTSAPMQQTPMDTMVASAPRPMSTNEVG